MSLNRYENALFVYVEKHPDERRHWQAKVAEATRGVNEFGGVARALERDLWDYFVERAPHVAALREAGAVGLPRVSMLNLAEHLLRLWGPPPKPKKPANPGERGVT